MKFAEREQKLILAKYIRLDIIRKMARNKVLYFLILNLMFVSSFLFAENQKSNSVFYYGSEPVTLLGIIHSQVFSGPPNYSSNIEDDEKEEVWIFDLEKSISVLPRKDIAPADQDEPETNVHKLHLVILPSRKIKVIKNKQVLITGNFMHSHTAHHRTNVLMIVDKIMETK